MIFCFNDRVQQNSTAQVNSFATITHTEIFPANTESSLLDDHNNADHNEEDFEYWSIEVYKYWSIGVYKLLHVPLIHKKMTKNAMAQANMKMTTTCSTFLNLNY